MNPFKYEVCPYQSSVDASQNMHSLNYNEHSVNAVQGNNHCSLESYEVHKYTVWAEFRIY